MTKREAIASIKSVINEIKYDVEVDRFEYRHSKKRLWYWRWELIKFLWRNRKDPMDSARVCLVVPYDVIKSAMSQMPQEYKDILDAEVKKYFLYQSRGLKDGDS